MKIEDSEPDRILSPWALASVLLPLLVLLFRAPFQSSFWLDESISFWVANANWSELWVRAIEFQGQSPLYFCLLKAVTLVLGTSELAARSISIVATLLSCFVLFRLSRRMFSLEAAAFSVLVFLMVDSVWLATLSARPYALALFLLILANLSFYSWLAEGKKAYFLAALVSLLLAFYTHYFALLGAFGLLSMFLFWPRRLGVFETALTLVFLVALYPGYLQLASLSARASELSFTPIPTAKQIVFALLPIPVLVACVGGTLIGVILVASRLDRSQLKQKSNQAFVAAVWHVTPILLLALAAHLAGVSLFSSRYYIWSVPGLCLLASYLLCALRPRATLNTIFVCMCFFFLIRELDRRWHPEQWRELISAARADTSAPLLYYSGLIEAESTDWLLDPQKGSYLKAPFHAYPFQGSVIAIPGNNTEFLTNQVLPLVAEESTFWLLTARKKRYRQGQLISSTPNSLVEYFQANGFHMTAMNGLDQPLSLFRAIKKEEISLKSDPERGLS